MSQVHHLAWEILYKIITKKSLYKFQLISDLKLRQPVRRGTSDLCHRRHHGRRLHLDRREVRSRLQHLDRGRSDVSGSMQSGRRRRRRKNLRRWRLIFFLSRRVN